jgi:glucosylceramidase
MTKKRTNKIQITIAISFLAITSATSQVVTPWLTSSNKSKLLEKQSTINFSSSSSAASVIVTVNPATTYQTIDGFGFSLTEGSAEVLSSLAYAQQSSLLSELFDTSTGLGISMLRIGIGASDLSSSDYSYNETSGDVNMTNFSLAVPDLNYLIPILKKIIAINPSIKILASPWSPPRWMKTNTTSWIGGSLNPTYYPAYANYFVKYFDAMKAQGINIWAITPQNEPENGTNNPSLLMNSTEQKNFINNNLGPAMANAGYSGIKIIAFDHNCNNTAYPIDVCNNSTYVDGAAFHLYAGDISALTTVKNATGKNVYFTEQSASSTGSFSGDFGWHMQNVIIGSLNNFAKATLEWNLATNSTFDPHTTGGCSTCLGAITVSSSSTFTRNVPYYIIAQIAKFVKPGAVRVVGTCSNSGYIASAFKNPDGTLVVVAYNSNSATQTFKIAVGVQSFAYSIPGNSAATFIWDPNLSGISEISMNNLIISPNPARDFITLKNMDNNFSYSSFELISMHGTTVIDKQLNQNALQQKIDVSSLVNGIYILKLKGQNGFSYGRFIKQ